MLSQCVQKLNHDPFPQGAYRRMRIKVGEFEKMNIHLTIIVKINSYHGYLLCIVYSFDVSILLSITIQVSRVLKRFFLEINFATS